MALTEARAALVAAAKALVANENADTQRALFLAAGTYHEARLAAASGGLAAKRQEAGAEVLVPFGRDKGKPLSAISKRSVEWLLGAVENSIADESKARFLEANQQLRDALVAELGRRP